MFIWRRRHLKFPRPRNLDVGGQDSTTQQSNTVATPSRGDVQFSEVGISGHADGRTPRLWADLEDERLTQDLSNATFRFDPGAQSEIAWATEPCSSRAL